VSAQEGAGGGPLARGNRPAPDAAAPDRSPDGDQTIEEMRRELALLRTVLETTSARIVYYDSEGRFLYATPAFARASRADSAMLGGKTMAQTEIPAQAREQADAMRRQANETGQPVRSTISVIHEGIERDTELVVEPVRAPAAPVDGAIVTAWDVTELAMAVRRVAQLDRVYAILSQINQAIVRIRERDEILQEACRIAADVGGFALAWIGITEPNGDVTVVGRAGRDVDVLARTVVTARDEPAGRGVVGTAIRESRVVVVDDAGADERMAPWRAFLDERGFRTAAAFPLRLGGKAIGAFALYADRPGYFVEQEVALFEELADDLSFALESIESEKGRGAAEDALRDSEQRYRDLFAKNPNPMWVYDTETLGFLAVNDATLHHYGYTEEEFLGLNMRDILPPEDVPAMLASVATFSDGYSYRGTWRHLRKDGSVIEVEVSGHNVDFNGRPGRLVSITDITERKRLEAQLAEATRMEAMGHLAGGIAHDFNNLLTVVNGYSELLVAGLGDSALADDAREIQRAGRRAAELTRQVLAFARRQVLAPRPVDVNLVVKGVGQMLARLIGEQVKLVTVPADQPAVVVADPGQLEQVLVNLAINARDAMPDGGTLEIRVASIEDAAGLGRSIAGPAVLLSVTDTGSGMDPRTLSHAFEPFFTTKQAGAGTGLGLATVHGIVHQSKGEVWAESSPGHGTTVSVLFARADSTLEPVPGPSAVETPAPRTATVLVVEDEVAVRGFVVSTLERAGYRVLVAGSPAEAVALTEGLNEQIDLLVTDLIMPQINGQVLAARLLARRPSLRVLLMSGYGASFERTDDVHRFLAKPFGRDELLTAVADALDEAEEARPQR
jgi:two-component system cell cycle sensor histidine kinase/response regulator CckA